MFYRVHYHPYSPETVLGNGETSGRSTAAIGHSKSSSWKFPNAKTCSGTNYLKHVLHERENCNYCQKKHLNKKWLDITAAITSNKKKKGGVTDFCGMLD